LNSTGKEILEGILDADTSNFSGKGFVLEAA
jgi:hypothetical protein